MTRQPTLDTIFIPPMPRRVRLRERGGAAPAAPARLGRWAPVLLTIGGFALATLPLPDSGMELLNSAGDGREKDMVRLIEQGQLSLPQAVELAEKHTSGHALQASCKLAGEPLTPAKPGDKPASAEPGASEWLSYEIECYAKDRVVVVNVDGLKKSVTGVRQKAPN